MNRPAGAARTRVHWLVPAVTLLLVAAGIGLGVYLTIAHYDRSVVLSCPSSGTINCEAVTTSSESRFLGAPVALLGAIYFVLLAPLMLPAAWRSTDRRLRSARVVAVSGGMAFVLWLVYAELVRIHKICLYCTAVHGVTFLLFVVVLVVTAITVPYPDDVDVDDDVDADKAAGPVRR